jgi:hypothetical protein
MCVSGTLVAMEVPAVKHRLNQAIVAAVRELVIMEVVANMVKLDHLCSCKLIRNVKT